MNYYNQPKFVRSNMVNDDDDDLLFFLQDLGSGYLSVYWTFGKTSAQQKKFFIT